MKTDKNSNTPDQGLSAQNDERAVSDTNKRKEFRIELGFTQYSYAFVTIKAKSLAEAEQKADEIEPDDIDNWKSVDGDMTVMCIEPVEEGESHE